MIKMSEQNDMSPDKFSNVGNMFNINPVDILMYLLSKWYWFVLSITLFGGYAWYQYAKTPYYYSRSSTIMIKGASRHMTNHGLDRFQTTSYTNVSNEILQFKSYKMMRDVVSRLNANIDYVTIEGLREKELYTQAPIQIKFLEDNNLPTHLTITPINKTVVYLSDFERGTGHVKRMLAVPMLYAALNGAYVLVLRILPDVALSIAKALFYR